ncbi:glycosyltransferase [Acidimicrobiia bacterium EGI L10123]|uniref:glycosyltransferase n=1 Tax=Salinilacustrithrix flava TaxID=2957203 RepID=UPI003D7C2328|nr:glycosyltransferase [Acidimicrobiia bacterium EGI L10123]
MLRVLHVIGPMRTGGAQTQLLGLVRAAHGKFWDATVCGTSPGSMTSEFEAAGIPVSELRRWGSPGLIRMARLRRVVAKGSFDVVHSNLWQSNLYTRLAVLGVRQKPKIVISERGVDYERSGLYRFVDRRLRSLTDAWVGNSVTVVEFIEHAHTLSHGQVALIPNAIDREIFRSSSTERASSGPLRVGTVGRLTWEKGHEVLIEAARILVDRGHSFEFCIAGEGPRREELEGLASGLPVTLLGALEPGRQVAGFLSSLDIFVLASHQEGRPNAVLEALAAGIPAIVCDAPGSVEALDDGGIVVSRGDPRALADALLKVAADLPAAERVARAAGDRVLDFDQLAHRYLELFNQLCIEAIDPTK